ncbi:MAG: zinc-binding dehydrogenase [Actinomycetia bacterium]|nr:zinc-binding dehydrogenase [Actinomycetes bacterium]
MLAIMLRELGGPEQLRLETVPDPVPGPGEVLVRLKAAALNRRDAWARVGQYPGIKLPAIPGSDGAGEVAALGAGVEGLAVGQAVVINPALKWGDNPRFYGPDYSILGIPTNGTFAQFVVVPAENVLPKPAYLSWEEAAALPLAGLTAYRALFTRGRLAAGETVFIPGVGGGVATVALQMAVAAGARVYVSSSSDAKLERARALGAAGGVNYRTDTQWARTLRNETGGVDLSVDSVGGSTFNDLIYLAKPGSRIVTFGATAGPVRELVMPRLFFKQLDVLGSTMGSPDDFRNMLAFCEAHRLRPVVDRVFPLAEAGPAEQYMEEGHQFGKIVLAIPEA